MFKMVIERLKRWLFVENFIGWIESLAAAGAASSTPPAFDPADEVLDEEPPF